MVGGAGLLAAAGVSDDPPPALEVSPLVLSLVSIAVELGAGTGAGVVDVVAGDDDAAVVVVDVVAAAAAVRFGLLTMHTSIDPSFILDASKVFSSWRILPACMIF